MRQVWLWVVRNDGQVEQHVGPFARYKRGSDGKVVKDAAGEPVFDEEYAAAVWKLLEGFDKQNAYDVAESLTKKELGKDKTGALVYVGTAMAEIVQRVLARQQRAESRARVEAGSSPIPGAPPLRAGWLADIELANMKVHVRGE